MVTALIILLLSSFFVILWIFGGYLVFLSFLSYFIKNTHRIDESYLPVVTLMIMTFNEERVIEQKIRNSLQLDYPKEKLDILVVDSASTDNTAAIVSRFAHQGIRWTAQEKRMGKGSAIRYGMKEARGEIIIISDANSPYSINSIRKVVRHFSDEHTGGVTGRYISRDLQNTDMGKGGKRYWEYERFVKEKETHIDSCVQMSGEMSAFRKIDQDIVPIDSLAEDFDMSLALRERGMRLIFEPEATVWEATPTNLQEEIVQKKRRIIGTLQALMKHKSFIFSTRGGWYTKLIIPSHKVLPLLSPVFIAMFLVSALVLPYYTPGQAASVLRLGVVVGITISLVACLPIPKVPRPFKMIKYFWVLQLIVLLGWAGYFSGSYRVTWDKIEGSRNI